MKKILITGRNGLIGNHLYEFYKSTHLIYAFNRKHCNLLKELNISFTKLLQDHELIPDVIIHCAAEIYDDSKMFDVNVNLTNQILEMVREYPHIQLINLSSSSIYGKVEHLTSEKDIIISQDMYAATKGAASLLCVGYAKKYNLNITDIRPYTIYGIGEKSHKLIPKLFRAFTNDEDMTLYDGNHDWTYIDDFINAIDVILNKEDKPKGDIVNIGSGIQVSNFEIYYIFCDYFGRQAKNIKLIECFHMHERDTEIWCCDNRYSKEYYGIEYKINVKEGIFKTIKQLENEQ